MLGDQSECRKLSPETEASVFMGATSVVVIDFPPSVFDTHYRCEAIQPRGLEEMLRLSQLKWSIHLNFIMSALTVVVSYDQTMYPTCLSRLHTSPQTLGWVMSCNHFCNLKYFEHFKVHNTQPNFCDEPLIIPQTLFHVLIYTHKWLLCSPGCTGSDVFSVFSSSFYIWSNCKKKWVVALNSDMPPWLQRKERVTSRNSNLKQQKIQGDMLPQG